MARALVPLLSVLLLTACGDNPEKTVSGVSVRWNFLEKNHGKYSTFDGEQLHIAAEGAVVQGRSEPRFVTLTYNTRDEEVELQTDLGTRSRIPLPPGFPTAVTTSTTYGQDYRGTINFSCFYGRDGRLEDIELLPTYQKGHKYDWATSEQMASGAKYHATFTFTQLEFKNVQDTIASGDLAKAYLPELIQKPLIQTCRDKTPEPWDQSNSMGIVGFTDDQIEIVPGNPGWQKTYGPLHKVDKRYYLREGTRTESIDLSVPFWQLATGTFFSAARSYNHEKQTNGDWKISDPRENLAFDSSTKKLTWTKADGASCGFTLELQLTDIFIAKTPVKHLRGFFTANFKFIKGAIDTRNPSSHCPVKSFLEKVIQTPDKYRLAFQIDTQTGNGLNIKLLDENNSIESIDLALPWSEAEKRLKPQF